MMNFGNSQKQLEEIESLNAKLKLAEEKNAEILKEAKEKELALESEVARKRIIEEQNDLLKTQLARVQEEKEVLARRKEAEIEELKKELELTRSQLLSVSQLSSTSVAPSHDTNIFDQI